MTRASLLNYLHSLPPDLKISPEKFCKLRESTGFTQRKLAQIFDVTETTISNWESGHRPCEKTAARLFKDIQRRK